MKNAFKLQNSVINIDGGFIPFGAEYTELSSLVASKKGRSGSFDMQFTNNGANGFTAKVLNVKWRRLK